MHVLRHLDRRRVALHLLGAELRLRAKRPAPDAAIAALARYRRAGVYPRGQGRLPGYEPVFHDPAGPVCAVASLMHATGAGTLADAVAARENLARVREMTTPGILAWAQAHGLDAADLERIQPTYYRPPTPGEYLLLSTLALLLLACLGVCGHAVRLGWRALRDRAPLGRPLGWWLLGVLPLPLLWAGYAQLGSATFHQPDTVLLSGGAYTAAFATILLGPATALLLLGVGARWLVGRLSAR